MATGYLYDGADIVQELAGRAPSAGLLTGLSIDERFSRTVGGVASSFLTDALGSTIALADSTGAIKTSYGYDPFGVTSQTGAANTSPYQYAGRENDGATGLYYDRARFYNPAWGRFISEDPIGLRGGVNLYAYANGDPLGGRDPSGLSPIPAPNNKGCPGGLRLQLSIGYGGTSFVDFGGAAVTGQGGISIPLNGSLAGTQIFGYGEIDPMFGLGLFAGAGPQGSVGLGGAMRPGLSPNHVGVHIEGGGAIIGGATGGGTYIPGGGSVGGSLGKGSLRPEVGAGGYFGVGPAFSGQLASPPLGCHE